MWSFIKEGWEGFPEERVFEECRAVTVQEPRLRIRAGRTAGALGFILLFPQLRGDACGDGADLSQGGHLLAEEYGCSSPRRPPASSAGHQLVYREHGSWAACP